MSKKLAAGAQAIVLDVKVGRRRLHEDDRRRPRAGRGDARARRARRAARSSACSPTWTSRSAHAVGNALEVREALATVRGEGPADLTRARARRLRARCSRSPTSGSTSPRAAPRAEAAVADGSAEAAWSRWIEAQGGTTDESALDAAPVVRELTAPRGGHGRRTSTRSGSALAALHLGAGRRVKDDTIDHAVGVVCRRKRGDAVEEGEMLAEVHARDEASAAAAVRRGRRRLRARRRAAAAERPILLEVVVP